MRSSAGFTLIELLVVILIVGILASIALPSFIDQRAKGYDTDAKTQARLLVGAMEECYTENSDYVACTAALPTLPTGVPLGTGPGQVSVTTVTTHSYTVEAVSRASGGGSQHRFRVLNDVGGISGRECAPAGEGACGDDGTW